MFEKEAEEYVINSGVEKDNDFMVYKIKFGEKTWELVVEPKGALSCSDWIKMYEGSEEACHKFVDWQKGAEFGYNKANEWHYVKDGDLPKDEDWKWCVSYRGYCYVAKYEEMFGCWTNQEYSEVMQPYAWKEIVLPELKESE